MSEMGAGKTEVKYNIDTELSSENLKFLPEFLKRNFLLQQEKYRDFRNVGTTVENLKEPEKIKHTFFRTVKENLNGFFRA